jgi:hypothetical protein
MQKHGFLLCALLLSMSMIPFAVTQASPDDAFKPQYKPTIQAVRVNSPVTVDGNLDESVWGRAARADNFVETSPGDQVKPAVASEALVAYDESNLYIALIAHDDPTTVRASLRERDNIFRDDYFGILLDTYNDQTWGYEIFTNPYGIQGDLRTLANGNEDGSFDIVFESVGKITDSGYQVELAIPFASLRFHNKNEQVWRINFWRDRQREKRFRYSWAAQDRDEPCFICQWGYLTGIEGIQPSSNIDILPNVLAWQSGEIADVRNPNSDFDNTDPDAEASLNVRYGVSSNASAEITFNPDFSQVESDPGQITANTTFGLWFSERRPFFQEGSDLLDTWITTVYTRSINDPKVAGKFTGQFGATSVYYLVARDENSTMLIPFSERSIGRQADQSTVNIARVQQSIGEDSYVGAVFTHRRMHDFTNENSISGTDGEGMVYGLDARLRLHRNYRLEIQGTGSHTREPVAPDLIATDATFDGGRHTVALDGESFSGDAAYISFERSARTWNADLDYWEYSPTFRTDNGFTTRNDYRQVSFWTGLFFRPNKEWLVNWEPSIGIGRIWNHSGRVHFDLASFGGSAKDEWVRPNLYFRLKNQTDVNVQYLNSRERFGGQVFEGISIGTVNIDSRFSELLSGGLRYSIGRTIYRDLDAPELAFGRDFSAYFNFKPTQRVFIQPDFDYSRLDHQDGYLKANPEAERTIFEGFILRNRLTYQFSRELYLRLIVQYDEFSDRVDFEPLITYQINPFTVFYTGVTSAYHFYDDNDYDGLRNSRWELTSRRFFAKLQYLFRV